MTITPSQTSLNRPLIKLTALFSDVPPAKRHCSCGEFIANFYQQAVTVRSVAGKLWYTIFLFHMKILPQVCIVLLPYKQVLSGRGHENKWSHSCQLNFSKFTLQLTVAPLLHHGMDFWAATLTQQMVQRCSTVVILVWFQREEWELCALRMDGVQILLIWDALLVCCSHWSMSVYIVSQCMYWGGIDT